MYCVRQMSLLLLGALLGMVLGRPDSGGHAPLPGPGLSYGGIPYGSMSGNLAEYFRNRAPPGGRVLNLNYLGQTNYKHIDSGYNRWR